MRTFELPFCMFVMVHKEHDVEEGLLRMLIKDKCNIHNALIQSQLYGPSETSFEIIANNSFCR